LAAIDNGNPPQTGSTTVRVNIDDINEFTPQFTQSIYNLTALTTTQPGNHGINGVFKSVYNFGATILGAVYSTMVSANDADGFYNTITYSLDDDYNGVFVIDQATGALMRTSNDSIPAPLPVST